VFVGGELSLWEVILKRGLTLIVMAAFGVHAYVQYRRHGQKMLTPERWIFFIFSLAMLFAVVVNFITLILAAKLEMKQGPFNTGIYSLLVFLLYLVYVGGLTRRRVHY
jgi:hypothetical protein